MNDSSFATEWLPWLQGEKLGVIGAAAISMGLLSSRGPPDWHPAHKHIREACSDAAKYCTEQGVDISSLAMWYGLHSRTDIPTTLISTASLARMKKNLESVYVATLTEKEQKVYDHVMATWMTPLNNATWEGIEVARYREKHAKALKGE